MPARKSRYSLPSESVRRMPLPPTNSTGERPNVCITYASSSFLASSKDMGLLSWVASRVLSYDAMPIYAIVRVSTAKDTTPLCAATLSVTPLRATPLRAAATSIARHRASYYRLLTESLLANVPSGCASYSSASSVECIVVPMPLSVSSSMSRECGVLPLMTWLRKTPARRAKQQL